MEQTTNLFFASSNIEISLSVDVLLKSISWFGIVSNDKD